MFKPKQILVPIDFSSAAWPALEDASEIAKSYGAALDIIHVWELPALVVPEEIAPTMTDAISAHSHGVMERFVSDAHAKGIAIRSARVVAGEAYRTIVATAAKGDYDLIVIGTHAHNLLDRLFLGSVAERVVRHACCSVFVSRTKDAVADSEAR